MKNMPAKMPVFDFSKRSFEDSHFRETLKLWYNREFNGLDGFMDSSHDQHLNWQNKSIEFLEEQGVKVNKEKLFSAEKYAVYKNKFGV